MTTYKDLKELTPEELDNMCMSTPEIISEGEHDLWRGIKTMHGIILDLNDYVQGLEHRITLQTTKIAGLEQKLENHKASIGAHDYNLGKNNNTPKKCTCDKCLGLGTIEDEKNDYTEKKIKT